MTDHELDELMRKVLLDAIKLDDGDDWEAGAFEPTEKYKRQMKLMTSDPLRWSHKERRPAWKKAVQRVAVVFLTASIGLGSTMAISPTVRAAVVQWIVEWYETHIVYRYTGEVEETRLPEYEISDLPNGYTEIEREERRDYACAVYQNAEGTKRIYLTYISMKQGAASDFDVESADVVSVTVNGFEGQLYISREPDQVDSTVTWIDSQKNLQFTVDASLAADEILRIAESVSVKK